MEDDQPAKASVNIVDEKGLSDLPGSRRGRTATQLFEDLSGPLGFALSDERYTDIWDVYTLYKSYKSEGEENTGMEDSVEEETERKRFRRNFGKAVRMFPERVRKYRTMYSICSEKAQSVHLADELAAYRKEHRERAAKSAIQGDSVDQQVREIRKAVGVKANNSSQKRPMSLIGSFEEQDTPPDSDPDPSFGTRHIDEFVGSLSCAPTLLALKLFPDTKEITESMAVFNAVRTHMKHLDTKNPEITVVCIGDGLRPRTASLFAMRTRWRVISVDPIMDVKAVNESSETTGFDAKKRENYGSIHRLTAIKACIEDVFVASDSPVIAALVHAHVPMKSVTSSIASPELAIVSLPCCNHEKHQRAALQYPFDTEYFDQNILSPKRLVRVWKSVVNTKSDHHLCSAEHEILITKE